MVLDTDRDGHFHPLLEQKSCALIISDREDPTHTDEGWSLPLPMFRILNCVLKQYPGYSTRYMNFLVSTGTLGINLRVDAVQQQTTSLDLSDNWFWMMISCFISLNDVLLSSLLLYVNNLLKMAVLVLD